MASLKASAQGLEIVDRARKRMGWTKTRTVTWWQTANTSQATLKRFWRGLAIQQENFIDICKAVGLDSWQGIAERTTDGTPEEPQISSSRQDWGEAPDVSGFYGRAEELAKLEQWIVGDRCRLVALLGMVGIGKTALSVMLADQIQEKFEYVIWRSLRYAPTVEDILAELIQFLGNAQETAFPEDIGRRLSLLIKSLQAHRCLLVLDEVQTVLRSGERAGQYREGYEGYGELFRRIAEQSHQSCLVLTSQEKPQDIVSREGATRLVRSLKLEGLQEADAQQVFREKGLSDPNHWGTLVKIYRGNPLWLNIISAFIQASFNGKVGDFLKLNTIVLGDISSLLHLPFERLSSEEQKIMYHLAHRQQPLSITNLLEIISNSSYSQLSESLESLERRSLIEKQAENDELRYTVQPVVRKYVLRQVIGNW
ncbi:MAG TPA: LuxR family transcriptional regulator [Cyanobacteria bacterium UBA8803]|nr:LuxR family transcriptional regulator [Cyanobacteria bacterium UBA9273]HBL62268.1 LuxR family transcriptional regulator [Cyanobacteria bacterium UBA8803]